MNKSFNLLDEPWLPVRMQDGLVCELGLLETFRRAGEISALAETAPPSLIAQYRLLLAITHRALSRSLGRWSDADRARWYRDGLPTEMILDYLEHWRERFWLFHPQWPFMQVAALAEAEETRDKQKPWMQISLASASGNAPVIFDHSCELVPNEISIQDALRNLLGFLQFAAPGTIQVFRYSDNACALTDSAAVVPIGGTLSETLFLALHPPTTADHKDLPAWELDQPTVGLLRSNGKVQTGPNDLYTRQTRAVLFLKENNGRVKWLKFGAGIGLVKDEQASDPMVSYIVGNKKKVRLTFTAGRAFWRDLPTLLPNAEGKASQSASVLQWAANLLANMSVSEQPVLVAGMANNKQKIAKLERWRVERFNLPGELLLYPEGAEELRTYVRQAESVFSEIRGIAVRALAECMPESEHKDTKTRARSLFDTGSATALYFSSAERSLGEVMELLGSGDSGNLDKADEIWRQALRVAADAAWQALCDALGDSPKALRAEARGHMRLMKMLRESQLINGFVAEKETQA